MDESEVNIQQYENQLLQVRMAAASLPVGPERQKLEALEADLQELIDLSKSSVEECKEDSFTKEYDLFKSEIEELDTTAITKSSNSKTDDCNSASKCELREELENLKGTKCQAPYMYKWTNDLTYSNAFITHVPELDEIDQYDDIKIKVMFTNPTHQEMLPCPYYLEGNCKFNDDKCRYSHGEAVLLSSLKEYREPDFSIICKGCKVLAKEKDGLWYRATVLSVNDNECKLKFESNSKEDSVPMHNVLPLGKINASDENISSDEDDLVSEIHQENNEDELVRRILSGPVQSALGEWEKFTKGFGSKMMAKMGYIHGSGLGKNGLGRVEPIPAVILPAGKSLDHCMMLKEKAGNDNDLFKAERKLKHLQRKHDEKLKRAYETEKEKTDVFSFLNITLYSNKVSNTSKGKSANEYKNATNKNLNVTRLQISEELRKLEKEIRSLNQSLTRHSPNTHGYNVIKEKLLLKQSKLQELHASERKVIFEQNQRRDRQKLTEF